MLFDGLIVNPVMHKSQKWPKMLGQMLTMLLIKKN